MKPLVACLAALLVVAAGATSAIGQTTIAATPAAGYVKLVAPGASDTALSVPLVKRSLLMARVLAVGPDTLALSAADIPEGAFAPAAGASCYVQFVTGNLEGLSFRILGNTATGVFTLDTAGEDLTNHALGEVSAGSAGALVRIRQHWTLGDVFGTGAGVALDSAEEMPGESYLGSDAILVFDNGAPGTEKPPAAVIAFVTGAGWRKRGEPAFDAGTLSLAPGVPFSVRRQRAVPAEAVVVGYASAERFLLRIPAVAAGEDRDVAVAWAQPGERSLAQSGLFSLVPWFGAMEASPDALNVRDALLFYPTARRGFGLPPAQRFHFDGAGWFESDLPADTELLRPGAGYTLRLRGARALRYWVQPAVN